MPVLIKNRQRKQKLDTRELRGFAQGVLDCVGCGPKELSLVLVNDRQIAMINRDYLGKDKPTNVISFAMSEGEFGDLGSGILGDVIVSVDTAFRHAGESGSDPLDEIRYLLIHGILHLIGYDHETGADARVMRKKEAELFSALRGYKLKR
jgi:probable rRNA maturation factor